MNTPQQRIRIIAICVILVFLVLVYRLYSLQIVQSDNFRALADRQYTSSPGSSFDRGSIYFTDKNDDIVSGATLLTGYYLAIIPKDIEHPEDVYNLLSTVVDIDADEFLRKANKPNDPFEEIVHHLTKEQADKITALDIGPVRLYKEQWRYYPFGDLASQSIGFVAYDEDSLSGRYGLERYYNDLLSRDDDRTKVNFFADIFLNLKENIFDSDAKGSLVTSIEPAVQDYLAQSLNTVQTTYKSKLTGGIIINPHNGEIYALGLTPTFDLNHFSQVDSVDVFSNPLVERVYEMGSIIKPLTMAVGIDSGAITRDSLYNDTGSAMYNGSKISNYDGRARGEGTPVQEILSQSLNVGTSWIMEQVGIEKFAKYFKSLGFGDVTGIDLPNETGGLISNLESKRLIEHATASFGQGIAMTPVETVRALSTLANGGKLVTPHIGTSMKLRSGITKKIDYPDPIQIFKKQTSDDVTKMLIEVVDNALRDGGVRLDNYTIAAKTGTAQIADNKNGGYYSDRFLHSFFGYFPARNPEFLVFLYTVEPQNVRYASETLTDSFMDITKFLLNYYNVTPDRNIGELTSGFQ